MTKTKDKSIKIAQSQVAELGVANVENFDIELQGTAALALVNEQTKQAAQQNKLDLSKSHFTQNFDEDDSFFYTLTLLDSSYNPKLSEVGIGYLKNSTLLKRSKPLFFTSEDGRTLPCMNGPQEFFQDTENLHIVVSNYIPSTLTELLVQPNSVIATSNQSFVPIMAHVSPQSILGRLDDDIQDIPIEQVGDLALNLIKSHTKQLIIKSSRLDVKKIKTNQITLDPHKKPDAKRGTLFYNDEVNALQFFDGQVWRTLSCKDD